MRSHSDPLLCGTARSLSQLCVSRHPLQFRANSNHRCPRLANCSQPALIYSARSDANAKLTRLFYAGKRSARAHLSLESRFAAEPVQSGSERFESSPCQCNVGAIPPHSPSARVSAAPLRVHCVHQITAPLTASVQCPAEQILLAAIPFDTPPRHCKSGHCKSVSGLFNSAQRQCDACPFLLCRVTRCTSKAGLGASLHVRAQA